MLGRVFFKSFIFVLILFVPMVPARGSDEILDAAILDFFPFGYAAEGGKTDGLSVTIFEAIARELGLELEAHLLPVPRALAAATKGETDVLYSYRDSRMVKDVEFLGNVGCLTSLVVPRSGINIRDLKDLARLRVGYVLGGYFAIRYVPNYEMIPIGLPSNEIMLRMLARNRIDAVVLNDAVLFAYQKVNPVHARLPEGWRDNIGRPFMLETLETHISLSDASSLQPYKSQLVRAIKKIRADGTVSRAYIEYGMEHGGSCDPEEIKRAIYEAP